MVTLAKLRHGGLYRGPWSLPFMIHSVGNPLPLGMSESHDLLNWQGITAMTGCMCYTTGDCNIHSATGVSPMLVRKTGCHDVSYRMRAIWGQPRLITRTQDAWFKSPQKNKVLPSFTADKTVTIGTPWLQHALHSANSGPDFWSRIVKKSYVSQSIYKDCAVCMAM